MKKNSNVDSTANVYGDKFTKSDSNNEKSNFIRKKLSKKRNGFLAIFVTLICFSIMFFSISVFASSNLLKDRMESLSDKERNDYIANVENSIADADTFSRELTNTEKKRMEELLLLYKNEGVFPESSLLVIENKDEMDKEVLAFVSRESLFVLPGRDLNDEEMLELIDFYYKRDYSIMQSSSRAEAYQDKSIDIIHDIDSAIPIEEIKQVVENIYDVQSDNYEMSVEADIDQSYSIILKSTEDDKGFRIIYNMDKGRIEELDFSQGIVNYAEGVEVNVDEYLNNFEYIKDMLVEDLSVTGEMEKCYCDYNVMSDGSLERGIISYLFIMKNGECYVIKYNCKDRVVSNILLLDYQYYQGIIDSNESKRENRGITRERIEF